MDAGCDLGIHQPSLTSSLVTRVVFQSSTSDLQKITALLTNSSALRLDQFASVEHGQLLARLLCHVSPCLPSFLSVCLAVSNACLLVSLFCKSVCLCAFYPVSLSKYLFVSFCFLSILLFQSSHPSIDHQAVVSADIRLVQSVQEHLETKFIYSFIFVLKKYISSTIVDG